MNIDNKIIWQIAAGDGKTTHYAKQCIQQDVVVFGPGRYGPWPECEIPMLQDTTQVPPWTKTKAGIIKRFAETVSPGDIVVLRVGTQHIYAVGEVVGKYRHSNLFSNVQGWDLQHYRRVRWLWYLNGEPEVFPVYTLKLGSSVQYLISPQVRQWLEDLDVPQQAYNRPLCSL